MPKIFQKKKNSNKLALILYEISEIVYLLWLYRLNQQCKLVFLVLDHMQHRQYDQFERIFDKSIAKMNSLFIGLKFGLESFWINQFKSAD